MKNEVVYTYITEERKTCEQMSGLTFETAAHIPQQDFPGYIRVWHDVDTDRAIYVKQDYKPSVSVIIGDPVSFEGGTGTIVSRDEQGMTIHLTDCYADYGMSCRTIYYFDFPIAFISRAVSVDEIYVVFF